MRSSLNELAKLLIVARPHLKLWLGNFHGFPMFDFIKLNSSGKNGRRKTIFNSLASSITLSTAESTEIAALCDTIVNIIYDIQKSIKNEANIQISSQVVANHGFYSKPSVSATQSQLDSLLSNNYSPEATWSNTADSLLRNISTIYKISKATLRVCIPLGAVDPVVRTGTYAQKKGNAIFKLGVSFAGLPSLLVIIEVIAYAQLRRAKFISHSFFGSAIKEGTSSGKADENWLLTRVRKEWLRVSRICNLGIDWCKHLSPSFVRLDAELRVRLHSYYAVALANLDRFFEAHRHLNEASGIQSKHEWLSPRIEQAKLGLRRAEVLLTEAHRVARILSLLPSKRSQLRLAGAKPETYSSLKSLLLANGLKMRVKNPSQEEHLEEKIQVQLHPSVRSCLLTNPDEPDIAIANIRRLLIAILDDAWFIIENSERSLSGHSQSSLWWGRIALMKLRACGYQIHAWDPIESNEPAGTQPPSLRMLAYRHRRINPQAIWNIFETFCLNNDNINISYKDYRRLRLIRYMSFCLQVFARCNDEVRFSHDCYLLLKKQFDECFSEERLKDIEPEFSNIVFSAKTALNDTMVLFSR